jgi:hypothetical protein
MLLACVDCIITSSSWIGQCSCLILKNKQDEEQSPPRIRMAVLPTGKGTRGYPTLLGKGTGIEFYPRVRVRV